MTTQMQEYLSLPKFSQIKTDTIIDEVDSAIAHCQEIISKTVEHGNISWDGFVVPIQEADNELAKLWSPISHMNSVLSSDDLRKAHDSCLPKLSAYDTWVGQHEGLFKAYTTLHQSESFQDLSPAQKKTIEDTLRDFRLSGIDLNPEDKTQYAEIKARLSELSSQFSNNLLDATHHWSKHVEDETELTGLPESALAAAAQTASRQDLKGWVFTADFTSYLPVMMYADNRKLREEMYTAYVTRASDQGPDAGKFDNSAIIDETLALRLRLAKLLGYDNYAELSLETKMADTPEQIISFLNDLAQRSKSQAEKDMAQLRKFVAKIDNELELQAWDLSYYSEKLKQSEYAISDELLKPYFPQQRVVDGLFEVIRRLYSMRVEQVEDIDTWHDDVRFYTIYDADNTLRGGFYLDLYARPKKRGGAWMDVCREKLSIKQVHQLPVAYLTCNFTAPVEGKPALLTHNEVVTLFHEFGHGLHHMLTQVDVGGVNGINGVAWDAVELPSQFLENWCWQPEALNFISGHFETGKPLPDDMLKKLLAAKDFQSAMQMLRQLEFGLFDLHLHQRFDPEITNQVQEVLNTVREDIAVVETPAFNRFQNSFGHIFAGGYAAGYYSYKWAEVLSADAFSRFEEEGIFSEEAGQSFLHNILEMGGSREPMELFTAFRGREPEIDALLRHSGITG